MVEGVGFEPTKAEPSDLQSGPFGHSGTPPNALNVYRQRKRRAILHVRALHVNGTVLQILSSSLIKALKINYLVPPRGVEPRTFSLQVSCSTN